MMTKNPVFYRSGRKKTPVLVVEIIDSVMDNLNTFSMVDTVIDVIGEPPKKGDLFLDPFACVDAIDDDNFDVYLNGGHEYEFHFYDDGKLVFVERVYTDYSLHDMVRLVANDCDTFTISNNGNVLAEGTKRGKTAENEYTKE